jgi:hypothetical protein
LGKENFSASNYRTPLLLITGCWLIFLAYQCNNRTSVWKTSETLWTDVIQKYPRAPAAQNNLGSYYQKNNQLDLAKRQFDRAHPPSTRFPQRLSTDCDYFRTQNQIDSHSLTETMPSAWNRKT